MSQKYLSFFWHVTESRCVLSPLLANEIRHPKKIHFSDPLCMLVNVGGAKEIRKFGQHLQPCHYCTLLFVPRYKCAQMYCNIYNGPILTFKTPKSTNLGLRNWFLMSKVRSHRWFMNESSAKLPWMLPFSATLPNSHSKTNNAILLLISKINSSTPT